MREYSTAISLLPWYNPDNQRKAVEAAKKVEEHLETMKLHSHSPEIYATERSRMYAQTAVVQRLWDADMDEWLIATVGKARSQLEVMEIGGTPF